MKTKFTLLLFFSLQLFLCEAQIEYIGVGYNVSYSRMRGFNRFVDAYNQIPNKIGGYMMADSMNKMHILTGIHFGMGIKLDNDNILELRFTQRKGKSDGPGNVPYNWTRRITYSMPTIGLGLQSKMRSREFFDYAPGLGFDLNFGTVRTQFLPDEKESKTLNVYFTPAVTPFVQFYFYPFGRSSRIMLSAKPYYQMNLWRRNFIKVNEEIPNAPRDAKLRSTCSNIGLEAMVCLRLGYIDKKPKKVKPNKDVIANKPLEPVRQSEEQTSQQGIMVTGTVLEFETNKPIEATITVKNKETGEVLTTTKSNSNGEYTLTIKEGYLFTLRAQSPGYITLNEDAELKAEQNNITKTIYLHPIEVGKAVKLSNVLFERGTPNLITESYAELDRLIQFMNENPTVEIELGGHTSNEGNQDLNMKLSEERVTSVKKYMVDKGVSASRIKVKAYGSTKPLVKNDTEENRQQNRRVEFTIIKK